MKQIIIIIMLLSSIFNTVWGVAANGTYNFSTGWTDNNVNLTHNDFVLTGECASDGSVTDWTINGTIAFPNNINGANQICTFTIVADNTNTASFELTGISFSEYDRADRWTNISVTGTRADDGTTVSSDTIETASRSTENIVKTFTESELNFSGFLGIQFSSFKISFQMASNNIANFTYNSFTITNAQAPVSTKAEPTNHPTAFTATSDSTSQITTAWTDDTVGTVVPDSYLVMCSTSNTFTDPVDGTAQTDDTSCSDGAGVQNIAQGTQTVAWTGLNSATQYYYKIFPYTNTGADVDYKIDGVVGIANATTTVVINSDATLTASSTISEPVNLPSIADTTAEAVNLFDFTITDGGGGDTLATDVSQIVLHTSGTADFSKVTWRLSGADASNVVGVYDSGANTLTFSSLTISVADGSNETYTVSGYYTTATGLTNKQTYIFSLDGDDDLTLSASGTQMSGANSAVNNGTGTQVAITASKLIFQTLPSN